jgi:adenylate kinase family enzyme
MDRIVIFGNSGSGKSTMARRLSRELGIAHLDLDQVAWSSPAVRRNVTESAHNIAAFVAANREWVAEGCYADLLELVMPHATEVRFLNPGTEQCVAHCRARPWEPDKYATPSEQDERLEFLIQWVREYETRTDEYSLVRHRAIFDAFRGRKQEFTSAGVYADA